MASLMLKVSTSALNAEANGFVDIKGEFFFNKNSRCYTFKYNYLHFMSNYNLYKILA